MPTVDGADGIVRPAGRRIDPVDLRILRAAQLNAEVFFDSTPASRVVLREAEIAPEMPPRAWS
jgi:hypothetical protein